MAVILVNRPCLIIIRLISVSYGWRKRFSAIHFISRLSSKGVHHGPPFEGFIRVLYLRPASGSFLVGVIRGDACLLFIRVFRS
jgi:hypothetical protein